MVDFLLSLAGIIAAVLAWLLFMLDMAGKPGEIMDAINEWRKS